MKTLKTITFLVVAACMMSFQLNETSTDVIEKVEMSNAELPSISVTEIVVVYNANSTHFDRQLIRNYWEGIFGSFTITRRCGLTSEKWVLDTPYLIVDPPTPNDDDLVVVSGPGPNPISTQAVLYTGLDGTITPAC